MESQNGSGRYYHDLIQNSDSQHRQEISQSVNGNQTESQLPRSPIRRRAESNTGRCFAALTRKKWSPSVVSNNGEAVRDSCDYLKGIHIAAMTAGVVLVINLILTAVAIGIATSSPGYKYFTYTSIYRGSCSQAQGLTTGLHFMINVLSTAALAASSFTMQWLSAPSREDIDRAHSRHTWLHVGVLSIKTLRYASMRRRILWVTIFLTSLPFHNLYNSAIFTEYPLGSFAIWLARGDVDVERLLISDSSTSSCVNAVISVDMNQSLSTLKSSLARGAYKRLNANQCFDAMYYSNLKDTADQGLLVMLTSDLSHSNHSFLYGGVSPSGIWHIVDGKPPGDHNISGIPWNVPVWNATAQVPNGTFTVQNFNPGPPIHFEDEPDLTEDLKTLANLTSTLLIPEHDISATKDAQRMQSLLRDKHLWQNSTWAAAVEIHEEVLCLSQVFSKLYDIEWFDHISSEYQVTGCLSMKTEGRCQFIFSPAISLIVILCGLLKVTCIVVVTREQRKDTLLTTGDAIASFISRPDPFTERWGLVSKDTLRDWNLSFSQLPACGDVKSRRVRWMHAASAQEWTIAIGFITCCIAISIYLLCSVCSSFLIVVDSWWKLGFGSPSARTSFASITRALRHMNPLAALLLANAPQIPISVAYFLCNNLLTRMLLTVKYTTYAVRRKPLRVSFPKGQQRSTYFLSLPYAYSLPLLATSTTLHWFVSQSLFHVRGTVFTPDGTLLDVISTCGFSPIAIVFAIAMAFLMLCALITLGLRSLPSAMPIAGSCSAAISAACHPPQEDVDAALKPVMWGEIPRKPVTTSQQSVLQDNQSNSPDEDRVASSTPNNDNGAGNDIDRNCDHVNQATAPHYTFTSLEVVQRAEANLLP